MFVDKGVYILYEGSDTVATVWITSFPKELVTCWYSEGSLAWLQSIEFGGTVSSSFVWDEKSNNWDEFTSELDKPLNRYSKSELLKLKGKGLSIFSSEYVSIKYRDGSSLTVDIPYMLQVVDKR